MTAKEKKELIERWKEHYKEIQSLTELTFSAMRETPEQKSKRIKRLLNDYDAFCEYYFPHFLQLRDKSTGLDRRGDQDHPQRAIPLQGCATGQIYPQS